jgi:hypothetical protein
MNSNIKIFLLCPVPEDQKPINEYLQLTENSLTKWVTFSTQEYQKKIFSFFFRSFCFFSLVNILNLQNNFYFIDWILKNLIFTIFTLLILLGINYFRWQTIENKLKKSRLFYEEASWYDGQIWEKPFSIIKNDQLLSTQKIKPILQRIIRTSLIIFGFLIIVVLLVSFD